MPWKTGLESWFAPGGSLSEASAELTYYRLNNLPCDPGKFAASARWYAAAAEWNVAYKQYKAWQATLPPNPYAVEGSKATHTCYPTLSDWEYFSLDFLGYGEGI